MLSVEPTEEYEEVEVSEDEIVRLAEADEDVWMMWRWLSERVGVFLFLSFFFL